MVPSAPKTAVSSVSRSGVVTAPRPLLYDWTCQLVSVSERAVNGSRIMLPES